MKEKMMEWTVQACHNPNKGWIIDGQGNKVTNLISIKMCRMIVDKHNREIGYLKATAGK